MVKSTYDFEIFDIWRDAYNIYVVVEHETGQREQFGYPLGEGWEEEVNDELRCVKEVKRNLQERINKLARVNANLDIKMLKEKHARKSFKIKKEE